MFLSPADVLLKGLDFIDAKYDRWSEKTRAAFFQQQYGSSPLDIADIWYDLVFAGDTYLSAELQITNVEKNNKGFKMYMMTHFFLWAYPKNSTMLATTFKVCERMSRGVYIWKWIKRIAALKGKKICWDNVSNSKYVQFLQMVLISIFENQIILLFQGITQHVLTR